ncbi:MAG: ketoacyl-ACP synthase III [Planctomycetes bacterium]|nr:ketoacyl-ACP synthase III [Planctomycetota bacterium]
MSVRNVGILGTGSYVPERILSNADLEKLVDTSDEWIFSRTGMRERRIAAPEQATSDLCIAAGQRALEDAGVAASSIDLIILATVTPDQFVPATACFVQKALGLVNAGAIDINAACPGFVTALSLGAGMVESGRANHVLVIGGECMSRIANYQDRSNCILFGDGSGAVVLGAEARRGRILESVLGSDGTGVETMYIRAGGSRKAMTSEALAAQEDKLVIKGNEVYRFAVEKFRDLLEGQMSRNKLTPDDFGLVIPHQVNYRIIESALRRLEIPESKTFINLEKYGNTSGASVGIALDEARRGGRLVEDKYVSMLAFGAGLTWGSVLLRW